jgi:hypothetical protein
MTTISQTIPSLGSPPLTTDPANFDTRADTLYGTSLPAVITATNTWSGQANTVAGEVNTNATNSATSATASATARTAAEAAQAAAQSASNATQWVSGQAYVAGNVVWSPINYLSYRAVGATSGTTDPSQSASWVLLAVDVRRFTNPLAQAVSVQMTASATVGGIQQLDNDNLDFGTSDFTVAQTDTVYSGSFHAFFVKRVDANNRIYWVVDTNARMYFAAVVSGATVISFNTESISAYYGQSARYAVSIIRETATAAGSYAVYINGVVFASGSIAAAATVSLSNAGVRYINSGNIGATTASTRAASSLISQFQYNRALTAAEVLSLSINGVALADRGASQTPLTTFDFSAGDDGFTGGNATVTGNIDGIGGVDNTLSVVATGTSNARAVKSLAVTSRTKSRLRVYMPSSNTTAKGVRVVFLASGGAPATNGTNFQLTPDTWTVIDDVLVGVESQNQWNLYMITATGSNSGITVGDTMYIESGGTVSKIGLTSELLASNAQSNTGQIFDTSGNKNHALLPASGATVVGRPVSQTREVRWTNTWAGTNELQYIGGVNQAILPANAYIESIVGTVSGATPHDIIIGDGSDTDRYVTITTGLAAGTTSFTLANRTTDGTNLKLTVDPDTNSDMSIAWVIKYTTLES